MRFAASLLEIVCNFLWTGTIFAFFHSTGKIPFSEHYLKIISRGLHINGPHIFNICMLILSWPWAFSESKFWIVFRMSLLEKVILNKNLCVLSNSSGSRLLPLLITVYCLPKNYIIQPFLWINYKPVFTEQRPNNQSFFIIQHYFLNWPFYLGICGSH